MIILEFSYCDHSNRLFQNLHFEAFCKEHDIEYINPSFANMHEYYISPCNLYKGTKGRFYKIFHLIEKVMRRTKTLKFFKSIKIFETENENDANVLLSISHRNIYVGGYFFRVSNLTKKYQDYFIGKYTLKEKFIQNNELYNIMKNLRENGSLIIGVHIRQGDYKKFLGGIYYFDDTTYEKYMHKLADEINRFYNKKCYFILFSNEDIAIKEDEYIFKSRNEWYIDHFLMSKCDYLIGPPSSFTWRASYIGKVKYFHFQNTSGNICLDDFQYFTG